MLESALMALPGSIMKMTVDKKRHTELVSKMQLLEKQQYEMFDMFVNEIQALQHGPFHVGITYLDDARKEHRTFLERNSLLKKAKDEFIRARGNLQGKRTRTAFDDYFIGFIESYISITWLMLEKPYDAEEWMEKSVRVLAEAQLRFDTEITILRNEIRSIEFETERYEKSLNDSIFDSILDFFFGDVSIAEKRRRLPECKRLVDQYQVSIKQTNVYKNEMSQLLEEIRGDIEEKNRKNVEGQKKIELLKGQVLDVVDLVNVAKNEPKISLLKKASTLRFPGKKQ